MSAQEIIDAMKAGAVAAVGNQQANELRFPLAKAALAVIEAQDRPIESHVGVIALTFVLSDFIQFYYPGAIREPMLEAIIKLLAKSVRDPPAAPL